MDAKVKDKAKETYKKVNDNLTDEVVDTITPKLVLLAMSIATYPATLIHHWNMYGFLRKDAMRKCNANYNVIVVVLIVLVTLLSLIVRDTSILIGCGVGILICRMMRGK